MKTATAKVLAAMVFTAASVPFMAQQAAPPDQQSAPASPGCTQSSGMLGWLLPRPRWR